MKARSLFLLCVFVLFLGSCKSATSPGDPTINQLFPLSVGNYWIYHNLEYNSDSTLNADYIDTLQIIGTAPYNSFQGFIASFGSAKDGDGLIYSTGSDMYSLQYPPGNQTPDLFLHYPMNVGQAIVLRDTTYPDGGESKSEFIFRGQETVSVTAGQFYCYHFTTLNIESSSLYPTDSSFSDIYLASGVGLVKNTNSSSMNGVTGIGLITTLTAYGKK